MRIREGWVEQMAIARDAFAHCTPERLERPTSDARVWIGRDVRAVDHTERRVEWHASCEGSAAFRSMTVHAVTQFGDLLAADEQRLVGAGRHEGGQRRNGGLPGVPDRACNGDSRQTQCDKSYPSRSPHLTLWSSDCSGRTSQD